MPVNLTGKIALAALGIVALANLLLGCFLVQPLAMAAGAAGMVFAAWRLNPPRVTRQREPQPPLASEPRRPRPAAAAAASDDPDALARQMLLQGRYALLLRPQVACNLREEQLKEIREALFSAMALVPDGDVVLGLLDEALSDGKLDEEEIAECRGRVVKVEHFLIDRYPVTNRQYYEFVAAGGYEQMALWDEPIWPAVLDFVDASGNPGPRFWHKGCYRPGREQHPAVGVSWYEALAYARWLGKRLPTGAEWVKAGSWPVTLSGARVQRRYPWGETMDRGKANLWGSGPGDTVPVEHHSEGVSVGGVYQLIGNVWEWTASDLRGEALGPGPLWLEVPMKSIRGGAFDTYFDNQATCHYQSGEPPISRRHNVGFRCAVGVCDLMLAGAAVEAPTLEETLVAAAEEEEEVLA